MALQQGSEGKTFSKKANKLEDSDSELSTEVGSEGSDVDDDGEVGEQLFAVEETLLIMDWDDTLLPTTWIEAQGLSLAVDSLPTAEQREELKCMAERASLTLCAAKSYGSVIIVTNAEHGWIELSCAKFMPSLVPILRDIKILSARSQFECRGVAKPSDWKLLAFRGEIDRFLTQGSGCWTNIISVGDSPHEREALIRVTDFVPNSWAKVLKLVEKPGEEEFLKEHDILRGILGDIVNHDGSLDVSICSP